jgi:hypothetical protein
MRRRTLLSGSSGGIDPTTGRDINKAKLSKENNLKLYYFITSKKHKQKIIENTAKYDGIYTEENTFTSMIKLLNKIKDNK